MREQQLGGVGPHVLVGMVLEIADELRNEGGIGLGMCQDVPGHQANLRILRLTPEVEYHACGFSAKPAVRQEHEAPVHRAGRELPEPRSHRQAFIVELPPHPLSESGIGNGGAFGSLAHGVDAAGYCRHAVRILGRCAQQCFAHTGFIEEWPKRECSLHADAWFGIAGQRLQQRLDNLRVTRATQHCPDRFAHLSVCRSRREGGSGNDHFAVQCAPGKVGVHAPVLVETPQRSDALVLGQIGVEHLRPRLGPEGFRAGQERPEVPTRSLLLGGKGFEDPAAQPVGCRRNLKRRDLPPALPFHAACTALPQMRFHRL